jgi:serine protease
VAGIVGAATNNGNGMAGAGWNVRVLPVRVLGKCFGYTSDIAAGIRWAAGLPVPGVPPNPNPARVINLSLGGGGPCDGEEAPAISEAVAAGVVVVAAAGNTSGQAAGSPANCPGAIGVAGLRHVGTKVGFSDVGSAISIAAPGGNCVNTGASQPCLYPILTTVNTGTTTPNTNPITGSTYTDAFNASVGTSFSSPLVAATAALMFSAQPALTPSGVRAGLQAAARPFPQPAPGDTVPACHAPNGTDQLECYCTTSTCGAGMLDAGAAVRAVLGVSLTFAVSPASPIAAQVVTLDSTASTVASGRTIASRQWTIVDGGGIVSGFNDAANGVATSLTPSAAGTFSVKLTITDDRGVAASKTQSVTVAGNGTAPPPASGGGGGGAVSWAWLMALLAGTVLLALTRRASRPAPALVLSDLIGR